MKKSHIKIVRGLCGVAVEVGVLLLFGVVGAMEFGEKVSFLYVATVLAVMIAGVIGLNVTGETR